jgi:DNA-binding transcriptional regulator YiaG
MLEWWQVKALRKSFGRDMTKYEFSKEIGVSYSSINRWEDQKAPISGMGEKLIRDYAKKKGKRIPRVFGPEIHKMLGLKWHFIKRTK